MKIKCNNLATQALGLVVGNKHVVIDFYHGRASVTKEIGKYLVENYDSIESMEKPEETENE